MSVSINFYSLECVWMSASILFKSQPSINSTEKEKEREREREREKRNEKREKETETEREREVMSKIWEIDLKKIRIFESRMLTVVFFNVSSKLMIALSKCIIKFCFKFLWTGMRRDHIWCVYVSMHGSYMRVRTRRMHHLKIFRMDRGREKQVIWCYRIPLVCILVLDLKFSVTSRAFHI